MKLSNIDLNLLTAFEAILKERNLTKAGKCLDLSQPAMSYALARLRKIFNDDLFLRTSNGMQPTPFAEELSGPIMESLDILRSTFDKTVDFNPAKSKRVFRATMTDYSELVILPGLIQYLDNHATGVSIEILPIPHNEIQKALERGELDLAIGGHRFMGRYLGLEIMQKMLFKESHLCMVRKQHPILKKEFTLKAFCNMKHALVTPHGEALSLADEFMLQKGIRRKIAVQTPHFLVIPQIIVTTDLINTIGARLAKIFAQVLPIQLLEVPFSASSYNINLYWHKKNHVHPASKWMRSILQQITQ